MSTAGVRTATRAPVHHAPALAPLAALVVAAALWGVATTATKFALRGFGPVTLLEVELVSATVVLWFVQLARRRTPRCTAMPWRRAAVLGLLEPAVAYLADTVGLTRTSAADASVVVGLESAFVVLLARIFLGERITRPLCLAIVAGFAGLVALEGATGPTGSGGGDLIVLVGALSAAAYTIVARGVDPAVDSLSLTTCQFSVAALAGAPVTAAMWGSGFEAVPRHAPASAWTAAVCIGVFGFGASFLIYNRVIVLVEARVAAVVLNLIPAFGLGSAVLWLGESLTAARAVGVGLIGSSVLLFTWLELRGTPPGSGGDVVANAVPIRDGRTDGPMARAVDGPVHLRERGVVSCSSP